MESDELTFTPQQAFASFSSARQSAAEAQKGWRRKEGMKTELERAGSSGRGLWGGVGREHTAHPKSIGFGEGIQRRGDCFGRGRRKD